MLFSKSCESLTMPVPAATSGAVMNRLMRCPTRLRPDPMLVRRLSMSRTALSVSSRACLRPVLSPEASRLVRSLATPSDASAIGSPPIRANQGLMNKTVSFPNFLPGLLALFGWVFILGGAAAAMVVFMDDPAGELVTPALLLFAGLYSGVQQFALAAIV